MNTSPKFHAFITLQAILAIFNPRHLHYLVNIRNRQMIQCSGQVPEKPGSSGNFLHWETET